MRNAMLLLLLGAMVLIPTLGCSAADVARRLATRGSQVAAPSTPPAPAAEPPATETLPTAAPTYASETPTPPDGTANRLGTRIVLGDLAITVNGAGTGAGPDAPELDPGKIFFQVYVTIENVSQKDATVYPDDFCLVDATGIVYDDLWNKPSVWDAVRDLLLDVTTLAPGEELEDYLLLFEVDEAVVPGLKARFKAPDGEAVLWDLRF